MWEDGDDDLDPVGGPLPDPSARHWRHPSELAGQQALPRPENTPIPPLVGHPDAPIRPLILLGGGLLAATAGVLAFFAEGPPSSLETVAPPFTEARTTLLDAAGSGLGPGVAESMGLTPGGDKSSDEASGALTSATTIVAGPPTSAIPDEWNESWVAALDSLPPQSDGTSLVEPSDSATTTITGRSADRLPLDGSSLPPTGADVPEVADLDTAVAVQQPMPFGLYDSDQADGALVAAVLPMSGHLVTSASASINHEVLWLGGSNNRIPVQVTLCDPITDVAIIELSGDEAAAITTPALAMSPNAFANGTVVKLAVLDDAGIAPWAEPLSGEVFSANKSSTTNRDRYVFGTIGVNIAAASAPAGSPIVDGSGQVMGMVIVADSARVTVLPAERVSAIANSLLEHGVGDPAWLGVRAQPTEDGPGLTVRAVASTSPAARVLVDGDILLEAEGWPLDHPDQLIHLARKAGPGGAISLTLEREGEVLTLDVLVGSILDRPGDGT